MKNISLKLHEKILDETEDILEHLKTSRNRYINDAIEFYNRYQRKKMVQAQLLEESKLVYGDSLNVLEEFEGLEDEL